MEKLLSPKSQNMCFGPNSDPAMLVVEITSNEGTRQVDFEDKWREYSRVGIAEYVIVDRDKPHKGQENYNTCVIVGKLDDHSSTAGPREPSVNPNVVASRSRRSSSQHTSKMYHRKIFKGA